MFVATFITICTTSCDLKCINAASLKKWAIFKSLCSLLFEYRYDITVNHLQQLHSTGMTWSAAAETLGVNRATIYRRRKLFGMNTDEAYRFSDIPDVELDTILTTILHHSPNAGESYVHGSLRARAIKIQRWRVRERLQVICSSVIDF